ncbi:hypothetical protein L2E82_30458 [Cichorium intybus]|uniref:Uncharacterized protein n=1 Tax=Cichorium intybus TaxID=13427 RepID=A0ACB9D0K6_CICIN|nr:hypothetical protein L2E82_30458 [Cichorium intybus]
MLRLASDSGTQSLGSPVSHFANEMLECGMNVQKLNSFIYKGGNQKQLTINTWYIGASKSTPPKLTSEIQFQPTPLKSSYQFSTFTSYFAVVDWLAYETRTGNLGLL